MTDLAAALADTTNLAPFDGKAVRRTTIAVTNAGDGLSQALKIDPREFHHGETVYVVLECEVSKVGFVPLAPDVEDLARVHTFKALGATIVDPDLVKKQLDEQAERILLAKEAAAGVARIEFPEGQEFAEGTMPSDGTLSEPITGDGSGEALPPISESDEVQGRRVARRTR